MTVWLLTIPTITSAMRSSARFYSTVRTSPAVECGRRPSHHYYYFPHRWFGRSVCPRRWSTAGWARRWSTWGGCDPAAASPADCRGAPPPPPPHQSKKCNKKLLDENVWTAFGTLTCRLGLHLEASKGEHYCEEKAKCRQRTHLCLWQQWKKPIRREQLVRSGENDFCVWLLCSEYHKQLLSGSKCLMSCTIYKCKRQN